MTKSLFDVGDLVEICNSFSESGIDFTVGMIIRKEFDNSIDSFGKGTAGWVYRVFNMSKEYWFDEEDLTLVAKGKEST